MAAPDADPSIEHEPQFQQRQFAVDPAEQKAAREIARAQSLQSSDERMEHSVWDEPGLSPVLAGAVPHNAETYAAWLQQRRATIGACESWSKTLLVALAAGPWAVLGAMLGGGETAAGIIALTVFAPVVEEVMKVAAALWVVEKRPFWFRTRGQIAVCTLTGGLAFAALENLLYLYVYVPEPSDLLIAWRWTICVALHMGCSLIAGLGLMRVWSDTMTQHVRPELVNASSYFFAAMILHGAYNGLCVLLALADFQF